MNKNNSKTESMFDRRQFARSQKNSFIRIVLGLLLVLVVLALVRTANVLYLGQLTAPDLAKEMVVSEKKYVFLGLSSDQQARKTFMDQTTLFPEKNVVIHYYTILSPGIFLVNKVDKAGPLNLGRVILNFSLGYSHVITFPVDFLIMRHGSKKIRGFYSDSFFSRLIEKKIIKPEERKEFSFIRRPPEISAYLKIPFLLYFFVPLVFIIVITSIYGLSALISCFYYLELFFLFNINSSLSKGPWGWVFIKYGWNIDDFYGIIIGSSVALVFCLLGIIGLLNLKKWRQKSWEFFWILVLLLLPLAIRF